MKTRTTTVSIKQQPGLYNDLTTAMNSNTDYDGWHVNQYQEIIRDRKRVDTFLLRKNEVGV